MGSFENNNMLTIERKTMTPNLKTIRDHTNYIVVTSRGSRSYVARNAERCLPKILSGVIHREMKINKVCVQYISRSLNHCEGKCVTINRAL